MRSGDDNGIADEARLHRCENVVEVANIKLPARELVHRLKPDRTIRNGDPRGHEVEVAVKRQQERRARVPQGVVPAGQGEHKDRPEVSSGGWVMSSFELQHGAEVNENPDTVPDELFDELFPPGHVLPPEKK